MKRDKEGRAEDKGRRKRRRKTSRGLRTKVVCDKEVTEVKGRKSHRIKEEGDRE